MADGTGVILSIFSPTVSIAINMLYTLIQLLCLLEFTE